jgi:hypothetical protein
MDITASNVTIKDEYNTVLYTGQNSGYIKLPAWSRLVSFYGDSNASVYHVDAWKSKIDAFSYGGSYAYTEGINDSAIIDFRGVSFKWYATIPAEIPLAGQVSIELRSKTGTVSTHTPAPISVSTPANRYRIKALIPTNYYTLDHHGKIIWDPYPHPHLPTGTVVTCKLVNIPYSRVDWTGHRQGGPNYEILDGPYKGHLISKYTNSRKYGKITVTRLNTVTQWQPTTVEAVVDTDWTSWTLIDTITLPGGGLHDGVSAEKVWEIPLGSNLLEYDKSYQIRITNLNGGFVSIK